MDRSESRNFYILITFVAAAIASIFLITLLPKNADAVSAFGADITPPKDPFVASSSHTVGQWSNDNTIDMTLSGASDGNASYESQITAEGAYQDQPVIFGNKIVWQDYRNGNWDIYMYDLEASSESRITSDPLEQSLPDIYGDKIVWNDYRNGNSDVYMFDLTASTETRLSTSSANQSEPVIFENLVVWQDNRNGGWDIYIYDLTASTETRLTSNSADQLLPAIDGDKIVWQDHRNGSADVFMFDLTASSEAQITSSEANELSPQISNDRVVWHDDRNGNWDVYLYDLLLSTEFRLTSRATDQYFPDIFGDRVVWQDTRNGNEDIYSFDLISFEETLIASGGANRLSPSINEDALVWQDLRNGVPDIYLHQFAVEGSGVDGFSYSFTNGSQDVPDTIMDIEETAAQLTSEPLSDGAWFFHLSTKDNAGNWTSTVHAGPYYLDTTGPDTVMESGPIGTITSREATFTWSGEDAITATADLQYSYMLVSKDADWSSFSSALTAAYTNLENGTYTFKVRTLDQAGNIDQTPAQRSFTVDSTADVRFEETSGNITYSSNCWINYSDPSLSSGSAMLSKKKSCTAIFSYTGTQVDFISAKAKQLGRAKIYIDNVFQTNVDLYANSTSAQQIVYTKTHPSSGPHALKVEVLATKNILATDYYVPIDAFDVAG